MSQLYAALSAIEAPCANAQQDTALLVLHLNPERHAWNLGHESVPGSQEKRDSLAWKYLQVPCRLYRRRILSSTDSRGLNDSFCKSIGTNERSLECTRWGRGGFSLLPLLGTWWSVHAFPQILCLLHHDVRWLRQHTLSGLSDGASPEIFSAGRTPLHKQVPLKSIACLIEGTEVKGWCLPPLEKQLAKGHSPKILQMTRGPSRTSLSWSGLVHNRRNQ